MNAWLTARRIKPGHEEPFRKKWAGDRAPEGMADALLLHDAGDPTRTISISLWDTADHLMRYRTSAEARKRDEQLREHGKGSEWSRGFVAWRAADVAGGRSWAWWGVAPLALLTLAGGGALLVRKLRTAGPDPATSAQSAGHASAPEVTAMPVRQSAAWSMPPARSAVRPVVAGNVSAQTINAGARPAAEDTRPASAPSAGRPHLLVRDLMTADPVTVNYDDDAGMAARRMRDLNVGSLPVLADGRLAGMITDRDITLGLADGGRAPGKVRVADLMTEVPATISPHVTAREAAEMMASRQVRRLPVVEGTRLVGIIALGDLAADGAPAAAGDALEEISEPARPQR